MFWRLSVVHSVAHPLFRVIASSDLKARQTGSDNTEDILLIIRAVCRCCKFPFLELVVSTEN